MWFWSAWRRPARLQHEVQEAVPTRELQVTHEHADVVKERYPGVQALAQLVILLTGQIHDGMQQKGEHIEDDEHGGEVLLAMAEVVFEMIAVVFERIVVFVLGFPAGAACLNDRFDRIGRIWTISSCSGVSGFR